MYINNTQSIYEPLVCKSTECSELINSNGIRSLLKLRTLMKFTAVGLSVTILNNIYK